MPIDHVIPPQNKKQVSGMAIVLIVLVAVFAIAGIAALVVSATGEEFDPGGFVGYWRATEDVGDGGIWYLRVRREGDTYTVFDSLRYPDAPLPGVVDGEMLVVELVPDGHDEYQLDGDSGAIELTSWAEPGSMDASARATFKRWDDAEEDLAVIARRHEAEAKESAVIEGVHALQVGLQSWAVDHGDQWPPRADVRAGGAVASYLDRWPENPYTGEPMAPGDGPGDYTYLRDGGQYQLTGHFEDGAGFTVP